MPAQQTTNQSEDAGILRQMRYNTHETGISLAALTYQPHGKRLNTELYDSINSELHWPVSRRSVHCSMSGTHFATLTEEYVRQVIAAYTSVRDTVAGMATLDRIIEQATMFAGPSPLWQGHVPNRLELCKMYDPYGFTVFMLNRIFKPEEMFVGNVDLFLAWRKDMIVARRQIEDVDVNLVNNINDLLLAMSGYGILPLPGSLPASALTALCTTDMLRATILQAGTVYRAFHKTFRGRLPVIQERINVIHQRTILRSEKIQDTPEKLQHDEIALMISEIIRETDKRLELKDEPVVYNGTHAQTIQEYNVQIKKSKDAAAKMKSGAMVAGSVPDGYVFKF